MATLKSKRKQKEQIENLSKEVEKIVETPVEEETSANLYLNEAEQEALLEQQEVESLTKKNVSIEKMQRAVEVAQTQFNLYDRNFSVNGFVDKGSKSQLSLSNEDFDVVITIKDSEKFGII